MEMDVVWHFAVLLSAMAQERNISQQNKENLHCQPGKLFQRILFSYDCNIKT